MLLRLERKAQHADIPGSPPQALLARITSIAANVFHAPEAVISIAHEELDWFAMHFGSGAHRVPQPEEVCAAATLRTHDGKRLGDLSVLSRSGPVTAQEQRLLDDLAAVAAEHIELRLRAGRRISSERVLRTQAAQYARNTENLYLREQHRAHTLQSALLPGALPYVHGVDLNAVYVPAGADSVIGGDWYDAFLLSPRKLLVCIGDVAGHGAAAALCMGLLRQSLRALALTESSPAALLRLLDTLLRREGDSLLATAFIAVIDLRHARAEYANAGHPPPLLRLGDGTTLEISNAGLPLGLRGGTEPQDAAIDVPRDSTLLLYTDGLTERTRDIIAGENALKRSFAAPDTAGKAKNAAALHAELAPGESVDDVAMMTLYFGR